MTDQGDREGRYREARAAGGEASSLRRASRRRRHGSTSPGPGTESAETQSNGQPGSGRASRRGEQDAAYPMSASTGPVGSEDGSASQWGDVGADHHAMAEDGQNGSQSAALNSTFLRLMTGLETAIVQALATVKAWPGQWVAGLSAPRLRLLPSIIFVAIVMLGFRLGDLWSDVHDMPSIDVGSPTRAETPLHDERDAGGHEQQTEQVTEADATTPPLLESLRTEGRSATEQALIEDLVERRQQLDDRERALSEREAMQEIAERRLDEKLAELEDLRRQIRDLLGEVDSERERQLTGLVAIYENMRPGDAATIFDGLDMDVLIEVLDRMAQRRSAPIIANMQPERARQVTRELAERGRLPDLQPLQD